MAKWTIKSVLDIPTDQLPADLQWHPVMHGNTVVGLINPEKGSFILHAMYDHNGNFKYYFPRHEDGPIGPDGKATPSVVVIAARRDERGKILVREIVEYRPPIRDPLTGEDGIQIDHGIPGGMAKKIGENPEQAAVYQALTEAGLKISSALKIYWASSNRAFGSTPIAYVVVDILGTTKAAQEPLESILGPGKDVPLESFPLGLDGIVDTAIGFAWQHFGMVRQLSKLQLQLVEVADKTPEAAKKLLEAYQNSQECKSN